MAKKKPAKQRGRRPASPATNATTHAHHSPPSTPRPSSARRPTPVDPSTFPSLLTVDEVADLLRTSRDAIYAKIRRGQLPGVVRLSRRVLIDSAKLLQWLEHRRAVSLPTQGEQR